MVKPGIVRLYDKEEKKINELDNIAFVSIWNKDKRVCAFWIIESRTVQIIDNVIEATIEKFTDDTNYLTVYVDV